MDVCKKVDNLYTIRFTNRTQKDIRMQIKFLITIFLSPLFAGCSSGFYDYYQEEDLWRIPLVEPYELKNIAGAKPQQSNNDNWHLLFKTPRQKHNMEGVNVTMINVEKGIIYGYGTAYPCQHFIINTNLNQEKIYDDIEKWKQDLSALEIDPKKIFDVFDLFEKFKDEKKLLWRATK